MRRTIITLNRFTTFIRSWRGNTAGLLLCFLILLFLSCKDDAAYIGYPKDPRLSTHFIDIPLNPSVLQYDAILTRNSPTDKVARFLFGHYNDPQFGNMEVHGFAGIAPPTATISPPSTAKLDSLVLQLSLDFYYYGSPDSSQQHLQVFEVLDTIQPTAGYYTTTQVNYGSQPLADAYFSVVPSNFDLALSINADADTSNNKRQLVRMVIKGDYGTNLLADMISNTALFRDIKPFIGKYKGFAFVLKSGDKIVGVNPVFTGTSPTSRNTRLSLYYSDGGIQSRADFPLYYANNFSIGITFPGISFTTITTDRSPTVMSGIGNYTEFRPIDKRFYVQSGTALITKLDLSSFYNFADTLKNAVFNSAEVVLTNVGVQKGPYQVSLRLLDSTNHFRSPYVDSLVNGVITPVIDPYLAKIPTAIAIASTTSNAMDVRADQGFLINVSTDNTIGKFFVTEFIQKIYNQKHDKRRVRAIGLIPAETEFKKSVSSLVIDPGTSLRLYYSQPVIKIR